MTRRGSRKPARKQPSGAPIVPINDDRCAKKWSGDVHGAVAIDGDRADRLLLAALLDDHDIRETVIDEVGDCADCFRGVAVLCAGRVADMHEAEDRKDDAIDLITRRLAKGVVGTTDSQ